MPYTVNFTDRNNKNPITVFDNTSNNDTSLTFPGRNVTGYGQIIAENFLALLENFASENEPVNPVEGQLWYDSNTNQLQIFDNTNWQSASGIAKGPTEPNVEQSNVGELWVDTTNQQLRIFTGTRWLLVGPEQSSPDGLRYGPSVETISDADNIDRTILIFYLADQPVIIFSKDSFTPKIEIQGFDLLRAGLNIATAGNANEESEFGSIFLGGLLPKLWGSSESAENLIINDVAIPASRFLRNNVVNTLEEPLNVRDNSGITLGIDGNFILNTTATAAKVYNSSPGSSVDLQTNRNSIPTTILRVNEDRVGINNLNPSVELDLAGDFKTTGTVRITNTTESTNTSNGSLSTAGGLSITKNLIVGTTLSVSGTTQLTNVLPNDNEQFDLGSGIRRWNRIVAKKIIADEIEGTIDGNITGNANTATNLKNVTTFQLAGDVISQAIQFDGQVGSATKIFNTNLTANIIQDKDEPAPNRSDKGDFVLTYRSSESGEASEGLLKQTRDTFVGDLGIPIGAILPFAGSEVPYGFLLCDGSEVERTKYPDLFDIIGTTYNGSAALVGVNTYRLPDLRGRFPLGRHNMDNGELVPQAGVTTGAFVDSGGGEPTPARVEGTEATTLGNSSGSNKVNLTLGNLPEHEHSLESNGVQYGAVRVDTAIAAPAVTGPGPTAPGQAQYLQQSGGIKKPNESFSLGTPVGVMNPFLTINYIIRSGPPEFETTF